MLTIKLLRRSITQMVLEEMKEKQMSAPMILPWLARKWDVSDARALELWRQACRDAEAATGDHSSSRYWGLAKSRMFDLLDNEVIARYPVTETPWVMIQLNVLRLLAGVRFWISTMDRRLSSGFSA